MPRSVLDMLNDLHPSWPANRSRPHRSGRPSAGSLVIVIALVATAAACGSSTANSSDSSNSKRSTSSASSTGSTSDLTVGFKQASWGSNVTVTYSDGSLRYVSDGLPNHTRDAEYALPNAGGRAIPTAATATAGNDPTKAQSYDYTIPLTPEKASSTTPASLGVIGVMISGAALFNPYEGDGTTVATQSNFSVKNSQGQDVWFLDHCNGHPNPMGAYHYHALPSCVTSKVDTTNGPSHIIGIAFDGYPIYGDRDLSGKKLTESDLDSCNGITSATPEFPKGVYHYVLLDVAGPASSIRCFSGTVDSSLTSMKAGIGGMPPGGGQPPN